MTQEERDKNSIKCSECGGHIMLSNSVTYVNAVDSQYRPVFGEEADVTLGGVCISNPFHKFKLEGFLRLHTSTPKVKTDE